MRIVIATAEPRGAYHLAPLAAALAAAPATFAHLVPYPEPTQGEPVVPVTSSLAALTNCDRLVVTGGSLTAWTEAVVRVAAPSGVPWMFSELAALPTGTGPQLPSAPAAVSALSADGAAAAARYLGVDESQVTVTGTPALDRLPPYRPQPRRAVLFSTSDMVLRDPDLVLLAVARRLVDDGWDVRVRLHPREDPAPWAGFTIVSGESQAESAASAAVVVGYPGSAHALAAAVGAPVVSVAPTEALRMVFSPRQHAAVPAHTVAVDDTFDAVVAARPPDPELVCHVVGPLGAGAENLVRLWAS